MPDLKPIAAKIKEADAILIGASNGLSITEGLHLFADNAAFDELFGDFKQKYGLHCILQGMMAGWPSEEEKWAFWARLIHHYCGQYRPIRTLREHISGGHYYVTFEPMFDDVGMVDLTGIEWIVIGTETGRRKGKTVSKPEWVRNLTDQAHTLGIPVFMKEDLLPIMGEAQMVQEFPPAFYRVLEEQKTWQK